MYRFFPSIHGIFSGIDHMVGSKINLNKFKKVEIIASFFSNYCETNSSMKLEPFKSQPL